MVGFYNEVPPLSSGGSSLESGAVASIHDQTSTFRQSISDSLDARLALQRFKFHGFHKV